MPEDVPLFGDDDPQLDVAPTHEVPAPIADWQTELIRKALDARSLVAMEARRARVEQLVGRGVASLRELTSEEALRVLQGLGQDPASSRTSGSAWDQREGDTWIDRH